jgi:hypothetical protein
VLNMGASSQEPVERNMGEASILIVDDDETLCQIICDLLELKKGMKQCGLLFH